MAIVTLITDLGLTDHYVALVKALILQRVPDATLVDVSHSIPKWDRLHGAFILRQAWQAFPPGTVHLIGVDTLRSPDFGFVAATWGAHHFVAPDNGLLTLIHDLPPERSSDLSAITRNTGISLFPERDILAVAVAHLAKGGTLEVLGPGVDRLHTVQAFMTNQEGPDTLVGQVMHVDSFGNLITNISRQMFDEFGYGRPFTILVRGRQHSIRQISTLYEDQMIDNIRLRADLIERGGVLLALFGSSGHLEVAQRWGHASNMLHVRVTDPIRIEFR